MLQEPEDQEGMALPNCQKYYLAGQMVFACRWLLADDGDLTNVLEGAYLVSFESLRLDLYRGTKSNLPLTLTMKATIKAWEPVEKLACPSY